MQFFQYFPHEVGWQTVTYVYGGPTIFWGAGSRSPMLDKVINAKPLEPQVDITTCPHANCKNHLDFFMKVTKAILLMTQDLGSITEGQ